MEELPIPLRWYLFGISICAFIVTGIAFSLPSFTREGDLVAFFILLSLLILIAMWPVRYTGRVVMFLSTATDIAAAWILSPAYTILIMIFGNLLYVKARNSWYKAIFNICQHIISIGISSIIFSYISKPVIPNSWLQILLIIATFAFYTTTYMLLTNGAS